MQELYTLLRVSVFVQPMNDNTTSYYILKNKKQANIWVRGLGVRGIEYLSAREKTTRVRICALLL